MATAVTQRAPGNTLGEVIEPLAQASKPVKHDVLTELIYYKDPGDGKPAEPYYVGSETIPERPSTPRTLTIHDVTGDEDKYTLDDHGFQYVKRETQFKDFLDNEKIKAEYYPEIEQIVKDVTGATRVFSFNHAVRRSPTDGPNGPGPGIKVHIDQSYTTAENYVNVFLPDEADELRKKRFQIINIWRPIKTILRDPFTIADAKSVPDSDLVAAARIYPDRTDETWMVKHSASHRWYFKYAHQPDEVVLFKCYDTANDGRARRNPHCAFTNPAHSDKPIRESVEVRTLVFYDE